MVSYYRNSDPVQIFLYCTHVTPVCLPSTLHWKDPVKMSQWRAAEAYEFPEVGNSLACIWMPHVVFFVTSGADPLWLEQHMSTTPKEGPAAGAWLLCHSDPRVEQHSDQMATDNRCSRVSAAPDTRKSQGTAHRVLNHGRKHHERECWEHAERTRALAQLKNGTSAEACMTSEETRLEGKMGGRLQVQVIRDSQQGDSWDSGSRGLLSDEENSRFWGTASKPGKGLKQINCGEIHSQKQDRNCFKRSVETAFFTSLTWILFIPENLMSPFDFWLWRWKPKDEINVA